MSMPYSIRMLGAVSPAVQTRMENQIATLEALHQQAYSDIATLSRAGVDTTVLQSDANALAAQTVALNARIATETDEASGPWFSEAADVQAAFTDLVSTTVRMRQDVAEGRMLGGLGWGVGVLAAAGAAGWYVWRQKRRRR